MNCRLSPHEEWVLQRATEYVACAFRGSGIYDRQDFASRSEARAAAFSMYRDRPVLVYAIYRTHQALIETIGELDMMNKYHLISIIAGAITVKAYIDDAHLTAAIKQQSELEQMALKHSPHAPYVWAAVREPNDLGAFSKNELVDIYNHIRVGKVITAFANKEAGIARIWTVLVEAASPDAAQHETETEMATTATAKKPTTRGAKLAAPKTPKEPKAAKAPKAPKVEKPKREKGQLFPLRTGSKIEALWNTINVKEGATADDMRKATGWAEARGTAKRLAKAAGKDLVAVKSKVEGEPTRYKLKAIKEEASEPAAS